ncbi:diguanylate cyclase domain-containing protein [Deinococcus roseus]|uniref:GGDEF domain-containing protein n=1 Tax=Deinococcus roseus TaxID=392414 RepID=A0ABQ2CZ97_9DEIO|nr:diguanylate cyclase [Deinococcus roseus]GGJ35692.1 hypothetical protein GCM10008938_22270 [Deinococcus roseus]
MPSAPLPIGILLDACDAYQQPIITGLQRTLEQHGLSSVVFVGRELRSPHRGHQQANRVYQLAHQQMLRGLVVFTASLGNALSDQEFLDFLQPYAGLPAVTIGRKLPGWPAVMPDNLSGMRALMQHLLQVRGCQRFLLVRGIEHNADSQEREGEFRQALQQAGIAFDEDHVLTGGFYGPRARELALQFFQHPQNRDIDAVVCLNDEMALGVMAALKTLHLRVPEDVLVTGFDDIQEGRLHLPPLTTVSQGLEAQGEAAAHLMAELLGGAPAPEMRKVPSQLLLRQSTGLLNTSSNPHVLQLLPEAAGLHQLFLDTLEKQGDLQQVLVRWNALMFQRMSQGLSLEVLDDVLCHWSTQPLDGWDVAQLQQHRALLSEMHSQLFQAQRIAMMHQHASETAHHRFATQNSLVFHSRIDLPDLMQAFLWYVRQLEVQHFYLTVFQDDPPGTAMLMLDLDHPDAAPMAFSGQHLLPMQVVHGLRSGQWWVYPLSTAGEWYGCMVFQAPRGWQVHHETFRSVLTESYHQFWQREQLQAHASQLEWQVQLRTHELQAEILVRQATEQQLQEANRELERLALLDGLTGLYNRMALERKLHEEFLDHRRRERPLGVILCDVDFFKKYNDLYGHPQGDECLRRVARILQGAARRPRDMAARYGGEEFLLLLPETDLAGCLRVAEDIRLRLQALHLPHAASEVAEQVTLSLGVVSVLPETGMRVQDLVQQADQALYHSKQQGRNRATAFHLSI